MSSLNIFQNMEKTKKAIALKILKDRQSELGQTLSKIPDETVPELIEYLEEDLKGGSKKETSFDDLSDEEKNLVDEALNVIFKIKE